MSTINTNAISSAPGTFVPANDTSRPPGEPASLGSDRSPGGLLPGAWIKIGIVAALLVLLFRFNLSRLWLKTNPVTGQENWKQSFFIPLIGLYYLYVHREELIKPHRAAPTRGSVTLAWGICQLVAIIGGMLIGACLPRVLDWLEVAVDSVGLLTRYHGWRISPLYLLLPYTVVTAVAAMALARRQAVSSALSNWSEKVWPALGIWAMAATVAWGAGFFVFVISQALFGVVSVGLAIVSLASLAAVVTLWPRVRTASSGPAQPDRRVVPPNGGDTAQGSSAAGPTPLAYAGTRAAKGRRAEAAVAIMLADRLRTESSGWFGGFILVWGVLFSLWGIFPGQNDFFKDVGMVVALFGVTLFLGGWGVMRIAWFPILFLFCGLPWPDQVYSWVAGPLQHLAAAVAVRFLTLCNVTSSVAGTKIMMFVTPDHKPRILNVEEACAGLKSLMTFVTLAAGWAFVFMSSRPLWHRLIQAACAVPIAILCNVARVSTTGLLDRYWNHEVSEGFAHQFVGLVMLIPAFFLILLAGWVMDNLFIEETDEQDAPGATEKDKSNPPANSPAKPANVVIPARRPVAAAAQFKAPPAKGAVRPAGAVPRATMPGKPAPAGRPSPAIKPPIQMRPAPASDRSASPAGNPSPASKPAPPAVLPAQRPVSKPVVSNREQPARGTERL